jgi:hypothetical protein
MPNPAIELRKFPRSASYLEAVIEGENDIENAVV